MRVTHFHRKGDYVNTPHGGVRGKTNHVGGTLEPILQPRYKNKFTPQIAIYSVALIIDQQ